MRVRKNLVRGTSSQTEVWLNKLLKGRGIAAAEKAALSAERVAGLVPWSATVSGLVAEDHKHLLVEGVRSYHGVANGTFMYDPKSDEAVVIEPRGRAEVEIEISSLGVKQALKNSTNAWKKLLAVCVEVAAGAYATKNKVASRWLVRRVLEAARVTLKEEDLLPGKGLRVSRDPDVIWHELGRMWVVQPWGIGTKALQLGGWE